MSILTPFNRLTDPARPIGRPVFFVLAVIVVILDQVTKHWAKTALAGDRIITIIPNFWQMHLAHNEGAAFSMFSGHTGKLALFSIGVSVILTLWAWRIKPGEQGMRVALGLILGGAVGNIIDRVWLGAVVDFIQWHWMYKYFYPTFNIADSAICVGIGLMVVASLRIPSPGKDAPKVDPGANPAPKSGSTP